jgi:serine/threonine protein phosphatase 1
VTVDLPHPEPAGKPVPDVVPRFPRNEQGRDFVVGDIHGMFAHLEALLEDVSFDPERDRLFSVGDLVDRGPQSGEALEWLARPWFFACRGNHEQFVLDSTDQYEQEFWMRFNGGEWWAELDGEARSRFREVLAALPLALEIETAQGLVGIVHADVPTDLDWEAFCDLLRQGDREAILYALFSRNRLQRDPAEVPPVVGVTRVFCGHTPVREPQTLQNVHFIDTAAVYIQESYAEARLTMVEFHPGPYAEHVMHTDRPV